MWRWLTGRPPSYNEDKVKEATSTSYTGWLALATALFVVDSKLLRKSGKPLLPGELDQEERKELEEYIEVSI